ncbi:hypothetical protein J3R82DRAFT_5342 [Butyriboletus roseoflavus]|nr:hypothetical protein J3R82DRAFT_5342 [Butyriboletus roseoflavus]
MPPKRKRAQATTAANSTTRSTKKSTKTTTGKNGAADVNEGVGVSNSIEPPSKKTKATNKSNSAVRGTKAGPRVLGVDDEHLNSSTSQQQSDDELDMPKQTNPSVPTWVEYTPQRAQALFRTFADDDDPHVIGPGGVEKLCTEAGISLEGAQPLILAWQFKAQEMAKLRRSEWLQGTEALRISSLPVLAMALKELDDLVIHDKEPITPVSSSSSAKKRGGKRRSGTLQQSALLAVCVEP